MLLNLLDLSGEYIIQAVWRDQKQFGTLQQQQKQQQT